MIECLDLPVLGIPIYAKPLRPYFHGQIDSGAPTSWSAVLAVSSPPEKDLVLL
jgi:hypothetical protein